jgi:two-component system phosphate regulon sensor histidine kinase PhoR
MSYVKTIIDAHKGKIKVESILGKGSTFTIQIPVNPTEDRA